MGFTSNVAIGQLVCLFSMMEDDEADNHSHSSHTEVQNSATKIYKLFVLHATSQQLTVVIFRSD